MQIKTTLRFHLTQSDWQSSREQTINAGKDGGAKEPSYIVGGANTMEISSSKN
jgi:hypothetical protein